MATALHAAASCVPRALPPETCCKVRERYELKKQSHLKSPHLQIFFPPNVGIPYFWILKSYI